MSLFGCASDEQFYDELYDEISQRDYDLHYCESNPSYYCEGLYCELKEFNFQCPFKIKEHFNETKN